VEDGVRRVYDHDLKHVGWLPVIHGYDRHGDRVAFDTMLHLPASLCQQHEEATTYTLRRIAMELRSMSNGRETLLAYVAPHGAGITELRELRGWRDV
jgi:hypothetical protein